MFVVTRAIPCRHEKKKFLLVNGDLITSYKAINKHQFEVTADCFGNDMKLIVDKKDFEGSYRVYNKGEWQ